ncbi:MAG: sugar ABC transporter substrate-binding protein [Rhodobacteraceae bacterium]|nr:sugar ABC transporter substrate-binding protein [Paracoccaceae bacterium]
MKKLLTTAVVAAGLTATAAMADDVLVLGKIPYTLEHSYHQSIVEMFADHADKYYGAKTIVVDGQANSDTTLSAVENLIAQGVDGIALHSPDIGMTAAAVAKAHAAGIPITTTLIYPETKNAPHIAPQEALSSHREGVVAAEKWIAANPDKPIEIAILDFGGFEQVVHLRTGPFVAGVKSIAPDAKVVAQQNGFGNTVKSMEIMLDILQANPGVNIIFGGNDDMALGALAAAEQLGRGKMDNGVPLTEIIAGVDGGENAMIKIFDPNSSFKLTQGQVRDNARAEVDTLVAMARGELAIDAWMEIPTLSQEIDYWNTTLAGAQRFLQENFKFEGNLAELLAN